MPTPVPVATIIVCAPCLLLSLALIKHKMALGGFDDNELAISPQPPPKKRKKTRLHTRPTPPAARYRWVFAAVGLIQKEGILLGRREGAFLWSERHE